ncbi:insulin dil [Plakobranchus ocellatus]|uniref:Insulin dil n=1 Tax=Plakobranchus ocellatus TaxID=259542 RepID=A0AAV4A5W4_9GAST|nr:insulin dil [Plakobranchus ocellatus]
MNRQGSGKHITHIWLGNATVLLLLALSFARTDGSQESIDETIDSFSSMSQDQLLQTWHTDCHRRCHAQLYAHVQAACENDPYRIQTSKRDEGLASPKDKKLVDTRLNSDGDSSDTTGDSGFRASVDYGIIPFLQRDLASSFLSRTHKRRMSSLVSGFGQGQQLQRSKRTTISEECCYRKACAWEEYAEYCQGHDRTTSTRSSTCS